MKLRSLSHALRVKDLRRKEDLCVDVTFVNRGLQQITGHYRNNEEWPSRKLWETDESVNTSFERSQIFGSFMNPDRDS